MAGDAIVGALTGLVAFATAGATRKGLHMQGKFLAIMHLADVDGHHANLRARGRPLDVFLKCMVTSGKSFVAQGASLTVLSDAPQRLYDRSAELGFRRTELPPIEHYPFSLDVPAGIRFRGAHFKIEVGGAIARGDFGPACGLVDIDTVAIRPIHFPQLSSSQLVAYALPDDRDMARNGPRIAASIELLTGIRPSTTAWYGGEYLYGTAEAYGNLQPALARVWERYKAELAHLHHVGDEMVFNACLQTDPGIEVVEAFSIGHLARWWSTRGAETAMPFSDAKQASILHLPADKAFLSSWAKRNFDAATFLTEYEAYVRRQIIRSSLSNWVRRIRGRAIRPVPRLSGA